MPVYEYLCKKCEKNFEIQQKMADPPKKKCPECSGQLVKQLSLSGFQLKGSGWYKTDYTAKKSEPKKDT